MTVQPYLHMDWETTSVLDLPKVGMERYLRHPSTRILSLAYRFGRGPIRLWVPDLEEWCPASITLHVESGGFVTSFNVAFEIGVCNYIAVRKYGFPVLHPHKCVCLMAQANVMGLAGSLEHVAALLGCKAQKDMDGHKVMKQMAKPMPFRKKLVGSVKGGCEACGGTGVALQVMGERCAIGGTCAACYGTGHLFRWWDREDPQKERKLFSYNRQDIAAECDVEDRTIALRPFERKVWIMDQTINARGVAVDVKALRAADHIVEVAQERLSERMRGLTDGAVKKGSDVPGLKRWLLSRGIRTETLQKADITELLDDPTMDDDVVAVLKVRRDAGRAATAKFRAILQRVSADERLRWMYAYAKAHTLRWASYGVNIQNLFRPEKWIKPSDVDYILDRIRDGRWGYDEIELIYGNPVVVLASCLRGMFWAEDGHEFLGADLAQGEARITAWLAGQEDVVEEFRKGTPMYEYMAARLLTALRGVVVRMADVSPEERQAYGKVPTLFLGYQGGVGAFQTGARTYNVKGVTDKQAEMIRDLYRKTNPHVKQYWYDLDRAAIAAVRNPGKVTKAGPRDHRQIRFLKKGSFLFCQMPGGSVMTYPYPRIVRQTIVRGDGEEWVKDALVYKAWRKKAFRDTKTYGGKICENIVQSTQRTVFATNMLKLEERNLPVVLHSHDEAEVERRIGHRSLDEVREIMATVPEWAEGLPLASTGWVGRRFRKE